ncbi:glycosyl transferase family 1 [Bacteroidia bacterium]|nr:glycosyl transferase family 1 [Bacteroidia bacterium]
MKIIQAIFTLSTGGAETMLVDIINQQCKSASVSLIIVNDKVNPDLLRTIDQRVTVFLLNRKESSKFQLLQTGLRIRSIVKKINPDVIHCHDYKLFPFFAKWRKKICLTVHSTNLPVLFLKYYRKIFAISNAVQQNIKQRTGIDAEVIYNGIEIANYLPRTNYDFNPPSDLFKIIFISRLCPPQKGQDVAIEAMHLLLEKHPGMNVKLVFVGDGEALEMLIDLAIQKKVDKHLVFYGQADRPWIKKNLKDFNLLIQPSLVEGFGLTVVEGFASGLPVIASNIDGPKEIINLLHAGLLVNPGDPADLEEKIYRVYENYLSGTLIDSGYLVKDREQLKIFDIRITAQNYLEKYESCKQKN